MKVLTHYWSSSTLTWTPNRSGVVRSGASNSLSEHSSRMSDVMSSDQWANLVHVLLNDREVNKVEHCEGVRLPLCSVQDVSGRDFL